MDQGPIDIAEFRPLDIDDRAKVVRVLAHEQPVTSELTFSNLFMWQEHYRPQMAELAGCLVFLCHTPGTEPFALPPVGSGDKAAAVELVCGLLHDAGHKPQVARAPQALLEVLDAERYTITPTAEHSDYVYLTQELIDLPGRRFHRKKNHLNKFLKRQSFKFRWLDDELVESVLDMQQAWCKLRECHEDPGLRSEDMAVYNALTNYDALGYVGAAVVMDGIVEAFTLGELLSRDTAVVHIEKANPKIDGLYAAINQLFAANAWSQTTYLNREQDLGHGGLRKAKLSYRPHHMVDKHLITPNYL